MRISVLSLPSCSNPSRSLPLGAGLCRREAQPLTAMRDAMSTSPGLPDRFWSHRRSIPQANSVATALQTVTRLAAGLLTMASATASWAGTTVEWKGGEGAWQVFQEAETWIYCLPL
jgi:hypothetical protein